MLVSTPSCCGVQSLPHSGRVPFCRVNHMLHCRTFCHLWTSNVVAGDTTLGGLAPIAAFAAQNLLAMQLGKAAIRKPPAAKASRSKASDKPRKKAVLSPEAAEKLQGIISTTYAQNQAGLIEEPLKQHLLLHPSNVSWAALPLVLEEPEQVIPHCLAL